MPSINSHSFDPAPLRADVMPHESEPGIYSLRIESVNAHHDILLCGLPPADLRAIRDAINAALPSQTALAAEHERARRESDEERRHDEAMFDR